jgi:oxygen-dependent protoporphyrinogen oxidase
MPPHIAVVGGGIAGLAAAYFLRDQATVTVLESSPRLGGKLAISEVAGISVDTGAEALLARRPEGIDLIAELGLADQLRQPGTTAARIWTRGEFRSLPKRQFMGVPADLDELERARIISPAGLARARAEPPPAARTGDVSVARYVGGQLGAEVVDRLVEPLLGGVYAGRPDQLSFDATLPVIARASRDQPSLIDTVNKILGVSSTQPEPDRPSPPVFTTLAAGLGTLPLALAQASRAKIKTKATVRELARTPAGWRLTVGPTIAPEYLDADAVILALPARPASRLVDQVDGGSPAAAALGEIEYASMAIVTLAYPVSAFATPLAGSGYLVPAVDGRAVKAATFSTVKWPHLDTDLHLVRCSVGRIGEATVLQRDDADLVKLAAADFSAATGVTGAPAGSLVTRWGGGLPQYTVGHLDRVVAIRTGVAGLGGLAVCGAAYDGIGIPACIASARLAVDQVTAWVRENENHGRTLRPAPQGS